MENFITPVPDRIDKPEPIQWKQVENKPLRERITKYLDILLKKSNCPYCEADLEICREQILNLLKEREGLTLLKEALEQSRKGEVHQQGKLL